MKIFLDMKSFFSKYIYLLALTLCLAASLEVNAQAAPFRAGGLSGLHQGINRVYMPITLPDDPTQYYLTFENDAFRPTTTPTMLVIYKDGDGKLFAKRGNNEFMTYYMWGDYFRNEDIKTIFYKRGQFDGYWDGHPTPQMQYNIGKDATCLAAGDRQARRSPYFTSSATEQDIVWATSDNENTWNNTDWVHKEIYTGDVRDGGTRFWGDNSLGSEITGNAENTQWNCTVANGQTARWQNVFEITPYFGGTHEFLPEHHYDFKCTIKNTGANELHGFFKVSETFESIDFVYDGDKREVEISLAAGESKEFTIPYASIENITPIKGGNNKNISIIFDINGCDPGATFTISDLHVIRTSKVQGTWNRMPRRFCQIDIDNENYLTFILKDNQLQNNSQPMRATAEGQVDDSPFVDQGADWEHPLYLMSDTEKDNNTKYLRAITATDKANAIKASVIVVDDNSLIFNHYVGDAYSGTNDWLGAETPNDLKYPGGSWKTQTDDARIGDGVHLQRTHETERDVWVFPTEPAEILSFSDFKDLNNYSETYVRWYDYNTDGKNARMTFPGQEMVDAGDYGWLGGLELTGSRANGTHAYYSVGSRQKDIWSTIHPATAPDDYIYTNADWTPRTTPTPIIDGNKITLTYPQATSAQWQNQILFNTAYSMSSAKEYELSVKLKSNQNVTAYVQLKNNVPDPGTTYHQTVNYDLTAGDEHVVTITRAAGTDLDNLVLLVALDRNPDNTTIEISDISLIEHTPASAIMDDVLDVVVMEASASFNKDKVSLDTETNKVTINEPTLQFRYIFNIRNAKKWANDNTADETVNNNWVTANRITLMAPAGTPFQYRYSCPEWNKLDESTSHPTDYWYIKSDNSYGRIYHYVLQTEYKVNVGDAYGAAVTSTVGAAPENDKACMYKARNGYNHMIYLKNPNVGYYRIKVLAADENGYVINIRNTSTPITLMEYELQVMAPYDGNMITWDELMTNDSYKHQRPAVMKDLYGAPTTKVDFDDTNPALTTDPNGENSFYKWPRKWEESSYAFGYNFRYDYNMYFISNNAKNTPYHEAVWTQNGAGEQTGGSGEIYDIRSKETGGKDQGFFYYTNAASDPGRMTILNLGKNFCTGTEVYVSAWVMEFSKDIETANVVFSFKGVDSNGRETTLNSFVSGYVTGGSSNTLSDGSNPDHRGEWHHVYFHFKPEFSGYDHYILSVENNCVSSQGADYAIDDIQAYICRPAVDARQMQPVCNGEISTNLLLTANFDKLLASFGISAADAAPGETKNINYAFVDKIVFDAKYAEKYAERKAAGDEENVAMNTANNYAYAAALIKGAYGTTDPGNPYYNYGELSFKTHYESNHHYGKDANVPREASYMDPVNNIRTLVFPSDASDTNMKVGSTYMISIVAEDGNPETHPGAADFRFNDECSKKSEFTVIFSGEVKVDGQLQSKEDGANVCANQKPKIEIDLNGIGTGGEVHKNENVYLDWYYGKRGTLSEYVNSAPNSITANNGSCNPHFTWVTDNNGNVIITICAGEGMPGQTKFRGAKGMNGTFTLSPGNFDDYFEDPTTRTDYTVTLKLKDPANKPAEGSQISYSGQIECQSDINTNDWSDYVFNGYTYAIGEVDAFEYASYQGVMLEDALFRFRTEYPSASESDFNDPAECPVSGSYKQGHHDCIKHFLDEKKISLYKQANYVSTREMYNQAFDSNQKFYITAIPFDPNPALGYTYCLDAIQITLNLNTRQPQMYDGDDKGVIEYPDIMEDVPLRIGLKQLAKARMNNLNDEINTIKTTNVNNYVFLPLRKIKPATTGVESLIEKSDDEFIYLVASDDPAVEAGQSGAVKVETGANDSEVRIIGRVVAITASKTDKSNNKCHLGFIKNFKFREGYNYTIKFHFQENYSPGDGEKYDVCPGDVICTIKVVPEYQKWNGEYSSDWNDDRNWSRVTTDDLHVSGAEWNDYVTDGGTNSNTSSFVPADFTKVIIPSGVEVRYLPEMYNLREAGNLTTVNFTGAEQSSNFIKDLKNSQGTYTTTDEINFHMSSVDISGDNVACRTWYDHTCEQIHFKPNAEFLSQQYLNYEKAWVDMEMNPGQWYTLVSPIKGVVAGDMYLPTANARQETPLFTPITYNTAVNDRFAPAVFQRGWDKGQAIVYEIDGTSSRNVKMQTTWSHVYNDVEVPYTPGVGYSIKTDISKLSNKNLWDDVSNGSKLVGVVPYLAVGDGWDVKSDGYTWSFDPAAKQYNITINYQTWNEGAFDWQSQFPIKTSLAVPQNTYYDFSCTVVSDQDIPNVIFKLTDEDDSENYLFQEDQDLTAGTPCHFSRTNQKLTKAEDSNNLSFYLAPAGAPAGTHITISDIKFQPHGSGEPTKKVLFRLPKDDLAYDYYENGTDNHGNHTPIADPVTEYNQKSIGHLGANNADPSSFVLLSIYNSGAGKTTVKIEQDPSKNTAMFDYLQVSTLASTGGDVVTGGNTEMSVEFTTPAADGDGNITLEILWSTINWDGRWMVQNVEVPANAVLPGVGGRSHRLYDLNDVIPAVETDTPGKYFLIGNPFMSHMDMAKFFEENTQFEQKYWIMTSRGQASAIMDPLSGGFVGSATGTVPPLQSFFVQAKTPGTSVIPDYEEDMMTLQGRLPYQEQFDPAGQPIENETPGLLDQTYSPNDRPNNAMGHTRAIKDDVLKISALDKGRISSQAFIYLKPDAKMEYDESEDVVLFNDVEMTDYTRVFSIAGNMVSSINTLPAITRTELGVMAKDTAVTTLRFNGVEGMAYDGDLMLYDELMNKYTPITEGMEYTVEGNAIGRLYVTTRIEEEKAPTSIEIRPADKAVIITAAREQEMLVNVYTIGGALVEGISHTGSTLTIPLTRGIYVVEVQGEDETIRKTIAIK